MSHKSIGNRIRQNVRSHQRQLVVCVRSHQRELVVPHPNRYASIAPGQLVWPERMTWHYQSESRLRDWPSG